MRSIFRILLSAGIVLSLAACQKGTTPGHLNGKAVQFSAKSGSVSTRTAFSGDGTVTTAEKKEDEFGRKILTRERIDWKKGDAILIASDNAAVYGDPNTHFATYTVASVTTKDGDNTISEATLDEKAGSEELFFNENETYTFWGIYPASVGVGTDLLQNKASFTIEDAQELTAATEEPIEVTDGDVTKKLTTLTSDMTQAVMLALAENQTENSVVMDFYPAFTAFEFTLNSATSDIILKELVLKRERGTMTRSLAGAVAATIKTQGGSTFVNTPSDNALTITFPENTKITKTDYVTFTVFALPEDIESLVLEFHLGADGSEIQKAELMQTVNGEKQSIKFDKCKKHCLRGIAVKGGWNFTYLTLDIKPLDWVPVDSEISSGDGVQATQFSVNGASNLRELKDAVVDASTTMTDDEKKAAKNANKAYRQYWVFPAGQEVTVTYKIMMPLEGTWAVELCGDDASSFTVSPTTGTLAGADASATYITLKINSNATGEKKLYLKTTVTSGGETYNLDSETQLYDMRGYHYFVVNGNVDTE